MKRYLTIWFSILSTTIALAQAPQAINYQAIIRDSNGNLIKNQTVGINFTILQGGVTGQQFFSETHLTVTNQFGQVNLQIGTGTVITGIFDTIPWNLGNFFLQFSVDITGGGNYQIMGTTQMLSVPYALYAEEGSGWKKTEIGPYVNSGCVGLGILPFVANTSGVRLEVYKDSSAHIRIGSDGNGDNLSSLLLRNKEYGWNIGTSQEMFGLPGSFGIRTWTSNYYHNRLVIQQDGKIGIGTDNPGANLHVKYSSSGFTPNNVGGIFIESGGISNSSYIFQTATTGGGKSFSITNAGNIGIGTTNPTYPLTVNGTIRSKKVIVNTGWSDFVFDDDYRLMPLHEVESFIKANRHLPEIPSAKEVEENGVSLGEISSSLLQKIEELTLYTIEQQKVIEELVKQNEEMIKKVNKLERKSDHKRNILTK